VRGNGDAKPGRTPPASFDADFYEGFAARAQLHATAGDGSPAGLSGLPAARRSAITEPFDVATA
jgi:hypothetical protein